MASSSTNVTDKSNTLSSVVSNLVRASMGTSLSPTVTDEDLDRHVAELILKEAKKKAEKYSQQGIRAYIASNLQDSNAPRTNKRFLSSIIRSTDDHNKAILKAQAEAAEEIKRARREEEKRERRARAEEAVRARVSRGRSRHSPRRSWREEREGGEEVEWDRWNGRTVDRTEDKKKRKIRSWETVDVDNVLDSEVEAEGARRSRRRRGREREEDKERQLSRGKDREDRDRHRSRRKHEDEGVEDKRRRRHQSKSASPRPRNDRDEGRDGKRLSSSRRHRSRSYSSKRSSDKKEQRQDSSNLREDGLGKNDLDDHDQHDSRSVSKVKEGNPSAGPSSSHTPLRNGHKRSRSRSRSPSSRSSPKSKSKRSKPPSRYSSPALSISPTSRSLPSPGPSPPPNLPSKMDKYFEESYDPRLDVAPLNPTPHIPSTGLITDADFEGWDAMLELIRVRREDKEERKRLERLGLVDKPDKKGKSKEKGGSAMTTTSTSLSGGNLLEIEYKKRGSVREWDLGKEGVDLSF